MKFYRVYVSYDRYTRNHSYKNTCNCTISSKYFILEEKRMLGRRRKSGKPASLEKKYLCSKVSLYRNTVVFVYQLTAQTLTGCVCTIARVVDFVHLARICSLTISV